MAAECCFPHIVEFPRKDFVAFLSPPAWEEVAELGRPSKEAGLGATEGLITLVSPPWLRRYSLLD